MASKEHLRSYSRIALFLLFSAPAFADPACPIGNPTCVTYYTTSTALVTNYVNTPVTQTINASSTTLVVFLNGTQISSQTWASAFTDPTVQNAVTLADTWLSGGGATFAAPQLLTSTSTLQSSVTNPPATFTGTCDSYTAGVTVPTGSYLTGPTFTTTVYIGPQTLMTGACQDTVTPIGAGQVDYDTLVTSTLNIPAITIDTYLNSQTYEILATTAFTSIPEPAEASLMIGALAAILLIARKRLEH